MTTKYIIRDLKSSFTYEYPDIETALTELKSFMQYPGIQQFELIKLEDLN